METPNRTRITAATVACLTVVLATGCGGRMPTDIGARDGRLVDCPSSPNCVSSFATDEEHGIDALAATRGVDAAWAALPGVLGAMERMEIVKNEGGYVHAVQTSKLMRYRDDLELLKDAEQGRIEVRSASRVGYGDAGVNRARVEAIRAALAAQGLVAAAE